MVDTNLIWGGVSCATIHISRLEADFDGIPIAMHPMRIASRIMVDYTTAETNIVALAIIVSLFVRGDEPRC